MAEEKEKRQELVVEIGDKLPPLKPNFKKPRHTCPFYGFLSVSVGGSRSFVDVNMNGCTLPTNGRRGILTPCILEEKGQEVDWGKCGFKKEKGQEIELAASGLRFFPKEFRPKGEGPWDGILFEEWKRYVKDDNVPRPGK